MTRIFNVAMIGLGNVGRNFLAILDEKASRLEKQYGLALRVTCVADSSGVAINPEGFSPRSLYQLKLSGGRVRSLPDFRPGLSPVDAVTTSDCDLVLEASPVNLQTGEPGLGVARSALQQGISVVLANKAPLVLAFGELQALAKEHDAGLAYSATVCGALPVINIGQRDLIAADIRMLQGIFNSTTNFVLAEMAGGRSYADALSEAQQRGIAETDPTLDVEGWDTANKLVIIANSFLGVSIRLNDVLVRGITGVTPSDIEDARAAQKTIKLLATARLEAEGTYTFTVEPTVLDVDSFLGNCDGWEMGIEIHSDLYGRMYHKIWEREPLPTAAAMLRDTVNLLRDCLTSNH